MKTLDDVISQASRGAAVVKMAGVVAGRQERKSARGNRFAFVQLSDTTGGYEVTMFSDALEKSRDYLDTGSQVVVTVEATMESEQLKLLARSVQPIDGIVADAGAVGLRIFVDAPEAIPPVANMLQNACETVRTAGRGPVLFCLVNNDLPGEVEVDSGQDFSG